MQSFLTWSKLSLEIKLCTPLWGGGDTSQLDAHIIGSTLPNQSVEKAFISTDLEPIWLASPLSKGCENFVVNDLVKFQVTFGFSDALPQRHFEFKCFFFHLCANASQNVITATRMFSLVLAFSYCHALILYTSTKSLPTIYHFHKGQSSLTVH
jgi:hypothetical protein